MLRPIQKSFGWLNPPAADWLELGARRIPLLLVRHARARRYLLRLQSDGAARVTIPRGGSAAEARLFANRNLPWLQTQLQRLPAAHPQPQKWLVGTEILFRGELRRIEAEANGLSGIRLGAELLRLPDSCVELRPVIEKHLRSLAAKELPLRVQEYASLHQLPVRRVCVRNQRTRWGSCSRKGTVSLNWRLIQAPASVCDYIILHELMHFREMNHSPRFWRQVERVCPAYIQAEQWLKQHAKLLER